MKRHEEKSRENLKNRILKFSRSIQTDLPTYLPRDRPSYRDARTHLKTLRPSDAFVTITFFIGNPLMWGSTVFAPPKL